MTIVCDLIIRRKPKIFTIYKEYIFSLRKGEKLILSFFLFLRVVVKVEYLCVLISKSDFELDGIWMMRYELSQKC